MVSYFFHIESADGNLRYSGCLAADVNLMWIMWNIDNVPEFTYQICWGSRILIVITWYGVHAKIKPDL